MAPAVPARKTPAVDRSSVSHALPRRHPACRHVRLQYALRVGSDPERISLRDDGRILHQRPHPGGSNAQALPVQRVTEALNRKDGDALLILPAGKTWTSLVDDASVVGDDFHARARPG